MNSALSEAQRRRVFRAKPRRREDLGARRGAEAQRVGLALQAPLILSAAAFGAAGANCSRLRRSHDPSAPLRLCERPKGGKHRAARLG